MLERIKQWSKAETLCFLTLVAFIPRLVATIFAPGYFAHDDHFLIIEAAQSWVDGHDYNNWLPWNQVGEAKATGHSYFYVGLHYLLFSLFDLLGLDNPKFNMVMVRLLHALWSLIIVRSGYRIARHLSNEPVARTVGMFLALFYFMPFLSVRNLPEMVCIPLMMLAAERLLVKGYTFKNLLLVGILLGIAGNLRFQSLTFAAGAGLVILFSRPFKDTLSFGLGVLLPLIIIQGGLDLFIWEAPFVEFSEYVRYNLTHSKEYISHPWYQYFIVILGILIPPLSFFLVYGLFKQPKKVLPILGGIAMFILVHSLISNKQERFILPIIPLIITIGAVGYLQATDGLGVKVKNAWKKVSPVVWGLNTLVLILLCFSYSKKSRIEIMADLRPEADKVIQIFIEDSIEKEYLLLPQYYADNWTFYQWPITEVNTALQKQVDDFSVQSRPNYAVFVGVEELDKRMAALSALQAGSFKEIAREEPGLLDKTLHWLNPLNRNETLILCRLEADQGS